ncbi:hypothetical protein EDD18DRAFT_1103752 [Armillaria luteobubalina]|uniref:Ribosome recycling factor n=1 Tax=Armillaria luteobubalina TaxID=153913 RepID=A0AA39UYD4_9AGAR|nr:hypothetical protein EDD18DRAFT_1103752 [Armillaria luteobubalina]
MQALLRPRLSFLVIRAAKSSLRPLTTRTHLPQRRTYAKKAQSTSSLQPGSQQPLTKPTDIAEHEKCQEKMKSTVEWLRRDCADAAARASGRVMPALLANVRAQGQKLEQFATVGVRCSMPSRKKAEEARIQCRKLHQTSVKGKYEKWSVELEVFQDLLDKYVAEIDKILVDMKKTLGVSR